MPNEAHVIGAQSAGHVLQDIDVALSVIHVHLAMFFAPFISTVFGHV